MNNTILKLLFLDDDTIKYKSKRNGWISIIFGVLALIGGTLFFERNSAMIRDINELVTQNAARISADSEIPKNNQNIGQTLDALSKIAKLISKLPFLVFILISVSGFLALSQGILLLRVDQVIKKIPQPGGGTYR